MNTMLSILGFLLIATILVCIIGAVIYGVCEKAEKVFGRIIREANEAERKRIALEMQRDSWWFSENNSAMEVLRSYSEGLHLRMDVSKIRDDWRHRVKEEK